MIGHFIMKAFPTCYVVKDVKQRERNVIKSKPTKSHKLGLCRWIYFIQRPLSSLSLCPSPLSPSELFMPPRKRRFSPQIFLIQSRSLAAPPAAPHCTACLPLFLSLSSLSQRVAASCDVQSQSVLSEVWCPDVWVNLKITKDSLASDKFLEICICISPTKAKNT